MNNLYQSNVKLISLFKLDLKTGFALLFLFLGTWANSSADNRVSFEPVQNSVEITGTVTDDDGVPLPGVNVMVKDTDQGTQTDFDGNYTIEAEIGQTVVYSYIGFITVEKEIDDGDPIDISLLPNAEDLEEAVVVAFGKQKKKNLTGSVSTVTAEAIEDRPINNVTEALQGTASGLNFSLGSGGGQLDNSKGFSIRGTGTVGSTNSSPLVLIDGMEGDLNSINPNDVKEITVLKDAAASSIYGSRAPFGVILVTTKKGSEGKMTVSYDANMRWSDPLLLPEMLNSENFANYFNDAARNAGMDPIFSSEILGNIKKFRAGEIDYATTWDESKNEWRNYQESFGDVDWFDQYYRDWVPSTEHNLSVRGGSEKVNYYFSANWLGRDGLMEYNQDKQDRYQVNAKINMQILPTLRLNYNTRFTRRHYRGSAYMDNSGGLFFHNIARKWPTLPVNDPNGHTLYGNEIPQLNGSLTKRETDELRQQLALVFEPIEGWETRAEFNYRTVNTFTHRQYLPIYQYNEEGEPEAVPYNSGGLYNAAGNSEIDENGSKRNYLNINAYSTYDTSIGKHNFKAMLGIQSELNKTRSLGAWRDMVYSVSVPTINTTYGDNPGVSGDFQHWATFGAFGRLNYNYDERYLLEVNMRYDGTSRFLRDQRWNWFPSVSAGWNLASENFWGEIGGFTDKINLLKFRASYGSLGNQNTANWYPFFQQMPVGADNGLWLINNNRTNTASAPGLISSMLTWEKIKTWNFGFDLSAFSNRMTVNFDYFRRNTKDMVGPGEEMPAILGTDVPQTNNADMLSKGYEIEVSWRDIIGDDFNYSIKGSLTDNRQKITRYNNDIGDIGQYYDGMYLGEIWGYETHGIAKTDEEMNQWLETHDQSNLGSNWRAGDIMYEDLNGDGKIDGGSGTLKDSGDRRIIGNNLPRYNFGLMLDMEYKGFDLSLFFQGTGKRDVNVAGQPYFEGANTNQWQASGFKEHLDYFRPEDTESPFGPNPDAYYPRPLFDEGGKNFQTQSRWIQNGAYVRLKNITLGYSLPQEMIESIGFTKFRIYFSAENVFTITDLSNIFDPETIGGAYGSGKLYPLSRVISTGLSITF